MIMTGSTVAKAIIKLYNSWNPTKPFPFLCIKFLAKPVSAQSEIQIGFSAYALIKKKEKISSF